MDLKRNFQRQWLAFVSVLIAASILTLFALSAEYDEVNRHTQADLLNRSQIIEENVGRQLQAINSVLVTIRDRLPEARRQSDGLQALNRELEHYATAMPSVRTLFVMDRTGTIIAASRPELVGGQFPQRDYFQRVKQMPKRDMLYIGQPFFGKLGSFVLNITRMVPAGDGSFDGIAGATLDPAEFGVLLESIRTSADATSALVHGDGKVFLMMPPRPGSEGMDVAKPESFFTRHMQQGTHTSVMTGFGLLAMNQRMVAMRTIIPTGLPIDKPMLVASGRDLDPVFAQWREDLYEMLGFLLFFAIFGSIALMLSQRRQRQLIADRNLIAEHETLLRSYIDNAPEGIFVADAQGRYLDVNPAGCAAVGYSREEILTMNIADLAPPGTLPQHMNLYDEVKLHGTLNFEINLRRKDGSLFPAALKSVVLPGEKVMGFCADITAQKEQEAKLKRVAHYDPLTHLPNRVLLHDRLHQALAQADRRQLHVAVVYLDLDGFKDINDQHGHETGDIFLNAMARRMKSALREGDTIARLGGDEFVAVLIDLPNVSYCEPLINRLSAAIDQEVIIDTLRLHVTSSLGVTFYPQSEPVDADQLLRQADQAMYQAKQAGKNRYVCYTANG